MEKYFLKFFYARTFLYQVLKTFLTHCYIPICADTIDVDTME